MTEAAKKGDLEALSGILNHETVDVTDKVATGVLKMSVNVDSVLSQGNRACNSLSLK